MCDQRKIHVFLGAPPPACSPASEPGAGLEEDDRAPARWRHLELTWRDGQLRPAGDPGNETGEASTHHDPTIAEGDWTENRVGQEGETGSLKEDLRPEKKFQESDAGRDDQPSASVHEYLDRCFPAAQPDHRKPEQPPAAAPLSSQTHYLTTWTLSQALILRRSVQSASSLEKTPPKHTQTPPSVSSSTPELFSPAMPSPAASAELFSHPCLTPRVEEGGVVLEATTDGVLCSQESTTNAESPAVSPAVSPSSKKARISPQSPDRGANTRLHSPTTLLARCDRPGVRYSVLVAVVHPCHLKEVKVKSGPSAGASVPLASIVVTDQSGVEMKVVLWRRAAFWALTVGPGDVLLITALQVNEDRWRGETVLQSTFSSKLLNVGQITSSSSPPADLLQLPLSLSVVSQQVNARSLRCLCSFLRERRPLLVSLPRRPPQDLNRLPYATLRSLRANALVHALLRVTHTHISPGESYLYLRSAIQLNAVLTVEQPEDQQGAVLLWGAAVDWLPRFSRDKGAVWDFRVLLVREGLTSDLPELHSTPWSTVQPVDPTDRRVQDFHRTRRCQKGNSSTPELDLDTLLSQKYSGDVELRVQVITFCFQDAPASQNAPQPVLDCSTSLEGIMVALSGDITYTGCGRCSAELDTDANDIYRPCYPCLPHTAVRRYYRPGVLTVSGRGSIQVCVQVPPDPLQKILKAPPDKLHRSSGETVVQRVTLYSKQACGSTGVTHKLPPQSNFLCDENSIPISQDFTLLDLQFLPEPR
uniref:Shieldin complex subunit 2 C-terminal domain-containing protein n=1 Tax=Astatotilapia calliptera TaxID=8154 RepID=A0A3P8NII8_ASTCA